MFSLIGLEVQIIVIDFVNIFVKLSLFSIYTVPYVLFNDLNNMVVKL